MNATKRKSTPIFRIISKFVSKDIGNTAPTDDDGSFGIYYRINKKLGCKVIKGYYYASQTSVAELLKSEQWEDAVAEFKLLQQAYKSRITPKPYVVVPIKSSGWWSPAIFMSHIKGKTPEYELDEDCNPVGETKKMLETITRKLAKAGIRHEDLGGNNIIQTGKRTYRVIDFTPEYIKKIPLTKQK